MARGITLTQFLGEQQRAPMGIDKPLLKLLEGIATVVKIISRAVNRAGLIDLFGDQGDVNVHGERVQKLDHFANEVFIQGLACSGVLSAMASEEMEEIYPIPEGMPQGDYLIAFDPLDGSSNIDVNVSIGSIFSVHRKKGTAPVSMEDFFQRGRDQVAAGYVVYGPSTMLVLSVGSGVHGFTLDVGIGEFLLSHEKIRIPDKVGIYSINEANAPFWDAGIQRYMAGVKAGKTARYVGSLVADFHRNLLKGGIFLYPSDSKNEKGKLRLLYEAAPLAFIADQAGGSATTGQEPILDLLPQKLHQRVPLIIGNRDEVARVVSCCAIGDL